MNRTIDVCIRLVGFAGMLAALFSILEMIGGGVCRQSCAETMASGYSRIFGIPVGLFAMPLWAGVLAGGKTARLLASAALAVGALFFLAVMRLVIGADCPLCVVHNSCAIAAFGLIVLSRIRNAPARPVGASAILVIGSLGLLAASFSLPSVILARNPQNASHAAVSFPVAPKNADSVLVISLACPHCYSLLYEYLTYRDTGGRAVNLVIKSGDNTRKIAVSILSAVYADFQKGGYADFNSSFRKVFFAVFRHSGELERGIHRPLEDELDSLVPERAAFAPFAEYVLESHAAYAATLASEQTPILVRKGLAVLDPLLMGPQHYFGK